MAQYINDVPPYSSDDDEREEDQREELLDGQRHRHKHRSYDDDPFLLADPEVVEKKKGFDFKVLLFPCTREAWRKPNMLHIFISFYLYMLSMAFSQAITPLVMIDMCGGDVGEASKYQGYLSATNAAATLFTAATLGLIADRWGRRTCLFISLAGFAVDMSGMAAAALYGWSVWPLFFTRAVGGASSGFYTAGYAYIADISSMDNRSQNFGAFGLAMGLAFMIGPIIAGLLGQIHLAIPLVATVGFTVVNILFVQFGMVESKSAERKPWQWGRLNPFRAFAMLLDNYYALSIALTYLVGFLAEEGVFAISVLFIKDRFDWDSLDLGIITSFFGLTYCLSQGVLLRFVLPRLGDRKSLLLAMFTDAISTWPYAVIPSGGYIYPLMLLRTVALMAMPISKGIISKQYGPEKQGELMGVVSGLKTITGFAGPLMYNSLFSHFSSEYDDPGLVYYVVTANSMVAFVACCCVFVIFPEHKTGYKPLPSEAEDINGTTLETTDQLRPGP
ncbi:transporter, major facilitator subfamily protein [Acanthamoeba castellanii str. Neff]|uniref:Transporter, major facilitator subfamily protein n=1 Tax=Acanthamoeba castellanii (strain ATCC 30010 / Neff) TaxID=1257118 RepID=L8H9H0_ACACF|nr:transporter, major facilitator subfamily protein [Acanthamoeba castellanii str. Neff]ELR21383.1 transporter, major facilitator subfamily protein [Acanthamoeba castellanii str. Neff]